MNEKWFAVSIAQIEKKLKTNAASGLSRKAARSAWYRQPPRARTLFVERKKSVGRMLGEILAEPALIILLLAAVFALIFSERELGITVTAICVVNIAAAFACYFISQRTMEQMNKYFMPTAKVIRGGRLYRTAFENVVAGDVVILQEGDIACADMRIITSDSLRVSMRLGRGNDYVTLEKQANGVIAENERDPRKMSNIIHAGSVIEQGSARVIAYATGGYTYLGAMTGGIAVPYNDNTPPELKKMHKICARLGMLSMLCVLPLSVLSLLLSHMSGGNSTLSYAFLTALAICASSMTQLSCTACRIFFVSKIKNLVSSENAVAVRTTDALDKLLDVDYLFMLDGSAVTDGVLHFERAFNAEGEIKSFDNYNSTAAALFEAVTLYNSAESNTLSAGINLPERFKAGLGEFLRNGKTDAEALKIRCPIRSYYQGTDTDPVDRVFYSDGGRQAVLEVANTDGIFSQCSHAVIAGKIQPLSSVGMDKLRHTYNVHRLSGKTVLVFTASPFENSGSKGGKCFLGSVVLSERMDKAADKAIKTLEKKGVKVVSFAGNEGGSSLPQIPTELHRGAKLSKDELLKSELPITYRFGSIDTYYGFSEADIERLTAYVHEQKRSVAVIGLSDYAPKAIKEADIFISCSPIINVLSAKSEAELYTLETEGAKATSGSCQQTVKSEADILICRPNGRSGGISALLRAFSGAQTAQYRLYGFFRYMLCVQLIRILLVGIPMVLGRIILDARHVLLCGFILDIAALLTLALDNGKVDESMRGKYRIKPLKAQLRADKQLLLGASLASLLALLLPLLMEAVGVFGTYLYRVEYLTCVILWLHLLVLYFISFGSVKNASRLLASRRLPAVILGTVAFVAATFIIAPLGALLDIEKNPLPYFIASFVPSLVLAIIYELLIRTKKE